MLRVILWKLSFVLVNTGKCLFWNKGPRVWHFSYGANVDSDTLSLRSVHIFSQEDIILEDFEMAFSHPGPFEGQGFADIHRKKGAQTYGKLYRISKWDQYRLHLFELALFLDRHRTIWLQQGQKHFYAYQATSRRDDIVPFCTYKEKIIKAYQNSGKQIPYYEKVILGHPCIHKTPKRRQGFQFTKPAGPEKLFYRQRLWYERLISKTIIAWYPHAVAGDQKTKK